MYAANVNIFSNQPLGSHDPQDGSVLIHCQQGVSRSVPGVLRGWRAPLSQRGKEEAIGFMVYIYIYAYICIIVCYTLGVVMSPFRKYWDLVDDDKLLS